MGRLGDRVNAPAFDNLFGGMVKGWLYRNTVEIGGLEIPDIPFATTSRLELKFGKVGHGCAIFPLFSLPNFMSFIPALFPSPIKIIELDSNILPSGWVSKQSSNETS